MKKILFVTAAVLVLFAGCTKVSSSLDDQDIKLEFTVAERPDYGVQTKAVKSGWEEFDEIRIILSVDDVGNDYLTDQYGDNSVSIMRFNGKWKEGNIKNIHVGSTGYYNAIYHKGNVQLSDANSWGASLSKYKGGEYLTAKGTYQYSDGVLKLSPIVMERPAELMQISVKGLSKEDAEGGAWQLTVEKSTTGGSLTYVTHLKFGSIELNSQGNVVVNPNNYYSADGVVNGDDISFCFYVGNDSNIENVNAFTYTLTNGKSTYKYSKINSLSKGKAYLLPALDEERTGAQVPGTKCWTKQ